LKLISKASWIQIVGALWSTMYSPSSLSI
jgi:hypothetical protein